MLYGFFFFGIWYDINCTQQVLVAGCWLPMLVQCVRCNNIFEKEENWNWNEICGWRKVKKCTLSLLYTQSQSYRIWKFDCQKPSVYALILWCNGKQMKSLVDRNEVKKTKNEVEERKICETAYTRCWCRCRCRYKATTKEEKLSHVRKRESESTSTKSKFSSKTIISSLMAIF